MMEKRRDKACVDWERAVETGSLRLSYRVSRIFFDHVRVLIAIGRSSSISRGEVMSLPVLN